MASRINMSGEDLALTPLQMRLAEQRTYTVPTVSQSVIDAAGGSSSAPAPPPGMPPLPPTLGGSPTPAPGATPTPGATPPAATPPPAAPAPVAPAPMGYDQAFQNFQDFIGYDFAVEQAMNALNNQYAAAGQLQSGAAAKGIADYVINMSQQMAAFPYLNYLTGQQAMGAQSASALAGVGSNFGGTAAGMGQGYANSVGNINAGMGGAIQSGANSASNAAIVNGIANANMWSGVGNALGKLGSSLIKPSSSGVPYVPYGVDPITNTPYG